MAKNGYNSWWLWSVVCFVCFSSPFRFVLVVFSLSFRCFFAVFSFGIRYVLDRLTNNERKHNERRTRDEREVNEKRTIIAWLASEFCSQMYKTITLYTICCVEICEWCNVARKIFLSTEHTEDTETILVEDYSKDFVLDLPIGYFCHDSAKNKFLDLFSALAAPKIRAVGDP